MFDRLSRIEINTNIQRIARNGIPPREVVRYRGGVENYLIIQRRDAHVGLFSYFTTALGWIKYAFENGMVPIVDMRTVENMYQTRKWPFRENSWETFFEQPAGKSLLNLGDAKSIMIVRDAGDDRPDQSMAFLTDSDGRLTDYRKIVRNSISVKNSALLRSFYNKDFECALCGKRILGVLARGTDYLHSKPHGHPRVPEADMIVSDCQAIMETKGFDYVYLVTEDMEFIKIFRKIFPRERLILPLQDTLECRAGAFLWQNKKVWRNVKVGWGYLKAVLDLSRCQGIVAARTNGAVAAALFSNGFEYQKYYDLGCYE